MSYNTVWQPSWAWALQSSSSTRYHNSSSSSCRRQPASAAARATRCSTTATPWHATPPVVVQQGQLPRPHHPQQAASSSKVVGTHHQQQPLFPQQNCASNDYATPTCQPGHQQQHHHQQQNQQLPDQVLFQLIQACGSWSDCLQLLNRHAHAIDAMLLSSLCTHTVYLYEVQQYNLSGHAANNNSAAAALGTSTIPSTSSSSSSFYAPDTSDSSTPAPRQRRRQRSSAAAAATTSSRSSSSLTTSTCASISSSSSSDLQCYAAYMPQLSALALQLAPTFRGQQYSNVLWCFARCGHHLPPAWTTQYLLQAQQHLRHFQPRNLAQLIWATAALCTQPPSSFLTAFLTASGFSMRWFTARDLANTVWGLAKLGVQPPAPWLNAAVAAAARCWSGFKPFELSVSVWGFAKLGVCFSGPQFWSMQQQQQPQQQPGLSGAAAGEAAPAGAGAAGNRGDPPFGWLLCSIALLSPAMGLQEIANLLWGLAKGRATLTQQQTQALSDQALIILGQSIASSSSSNTSTSTSTSTSSSSSTAFTASITVCTWALSHLAWAPTLPQARMLMQLIQQEALCSRAMDMKHASLLLFSLGRLQLRLSQPAMQHLMDSLAAGLRFAGMSEVLQVLTACRRLGWRVSKPWWKQLYADGLAAVRQGNAAELVHLLATIASLKPVRPTPAWWEAFWESIGVELEATLTSLGMSRLARTRNLPKGAIAILAAPRKATVKRHKRHLLQRRCRRRLQELKAGKGYQRLRTPQILQQRSSTSSSRAAGWRLGSRSSSSSSGRRKRQWRPHALAWLSMAESLEIVTNLQHLVRQHHQQCQQQQPPCAVGDDVTTPMTPARAAVLLWACARLRRMPPKALLWQLLLVVLVGVHSLSCTHLTVALWSVARLVHRFGRGRVQCFMLVKPLALVAQWRLLVGLAGVGSSQQERRRLLTALRYLASEDSCLMASMLLQSRSRAKWGMDLGAVWVMMGRQ